MSVFVSLLALGFLMLVAYRGYSVILFAPVAAMLAVLCTSPSAVAPMFVGDSHATRFVRDGSFPWNPGRRAALVDVRQIGDVVLLRYALSSRFEDG